MMPQFAVNHMSFARMSYARLLEIAREIGAIGVEVRNDLSRPLFDGLTPADAGRMARDGGLRLLAVTEVKRFNDWGDDREAEACALIDIAREAGAEAVTFAPRNDNLGMGNGERQANLRLALKHVAPMLADAGLVGFVQPVGFDTSSLQHKHELVEAIERLGLTGRIKVIHDTFHHDMAGGGPAFAEHTGIVHISGVVDPVVGKGEMTDADRVLVDERDRIGNIAQISALLEDGYTGPLSFETFADSVQELPDPVAALKRSIDFIMERSGLAAR